MAADVDPPAAFRSPLTREANAGKVALITGGGTGIGRATALELARTGASIVICGRRTEPLEATAQLLEASGSESLAVPVDLREPENVERLVDRALERFGRIDILVNNAGGQFLAPATGISANGWRAVLRISLDAMFEVSRVVGIRSMIPNRGGVIVFVGFSPQKGLPNVAHGSAARAGVQSLSESLACEWSQYRIRTVYLAAGAVHSGHFLDNDEGLERAAQASLMGRVAVPAEIATVIAFLTSSGGSYITGSTVVVDGGLAAWTAAGPPPPRTSSVE